MHGRHNYNYTLLTYNSPSLSLSVLHTSMRGHNAHVSLLSHDTTTPSVRKTILSYGYMANILAGYPRLTDYYASNWARATELSRLIIEASTSKIPKGGVGIKP